MDRSDWISLAVTLVAIALSYYLGGARTAAYCGVTGVLILFVLILFRRRNKDTNSLSTQSSQQTANPVITQNANPTINVNIANQPQAHEPKPVRAVINDPEPNIRFIESKAVDIYEAEGKFSKTQDGLGDLRVTVVCFRNEGILGREVREPDIKAHVIYKDVNGNEIADVPRAVWLQEYKGHTPFNTGEKKCLILFLLTKQGTLKRLWKEAYFHEHSWMSGGPSFRVGDERIPAQVATVEISLLSESGGKCLKYLTFQAESYSEGELPRLVLKAE